MLLLPFLVLVLLEHRQVTAGPSSPPPHLLLVVIDDLGIDDTGLRTERPQRRTASRPNWRHWGVVLSDYYAPTTCARPLPPAAP